jgi:hypothetical protein
MASNGLKYFTTYLQSHEERYAKFRQEAYDELVLQKKMDEEYRAALREREKVLQDAVNKLRKGGAEGIDALDIIKERRATNQAIISAKNEARDARLKIRERLDGELTVPQGAQTKLAEASTALSTAGGLIANPQGLQAFIEGQIINVSSAVKGGTRSAASTAQQLWKGLKSDNTWNKLSSEQRIALEEKVTSQFGLDAVNIGGVSGSGLLDTPQDVLLKKEEDALLAQEGGAYGVSSLSQLLADLEALKDGGDQAAIDAKQAQIEAALEPEKEELVAIREKLSKPPVPFQPSEADVRQRAAEKYGFEAPKFMKEQFARDVLGTDKNKLLHYDAIQAAKSSPIKRNLDVYKQALILSQNKQLLGESKAEQREKIILKAAEYAGGDTDMRDKFLIAYHQIQMDEQRAKYEPSSVLPEPKQTMDVDMTPTKDSFPKTAGIKTDEEGYFTTRGGMRVYVAPPFRERELKQPASSPPVLPTEEDENRFGVNYTGLPYRLSLDEPPELAEDESLTPRQKFYKKRIKPNTDMSMKSLFELDL